jgi:hypothetical protein
MQNQNCSACGEIDFTAFCDIHAYTKMQKPTFSPSPHTYIHTTHKLSLSCFLLMSGCYKSQTLYEMDLYDSENAAEFLQNVTLLSE